MTYLDGLFFNLKYYFLFYIVARVYFTKFKQKKRVYFTNLPLTLRLEWKRIIAERISIREENLKKIE